MSSGLDLTWRKTGAEQTERNLEGERDKKGEAQLSKGVDFEM